jgi:hypothetical protein
MSRAARVLGSALALAAASCGPYANVAQKLDVTARVVGDTWIARGGPDEVRVLLVGTPSAEGSAPFSFSSLYVPVSAGKSVYTLQGTWIEVGSAGDTTVHVEHAYTYPDESSLNILARTGTSRSDDRFQIPLTVTRSGDQLVVSGDPRMAGTYVALTHALAQLGTATEPDAACAFQVANVAMLRSEGRIIGFGGPGITQYTDPETYIGTVAGSLRISASLTGGFPPSHSTVTVQYRAFEDIGGVTVDGPMVTDADSGGSGLMSGVVTFAFQPVAPDGTPATAITGTIDYGANAIVITGGNPVAGSYTVAIEGGGTALVPTATAPTPSLAECLALP